MIYTLDIHYTQIIYTLYLYIMMMKIIKHFLPADVPSDIPPTYPQTRPMGLISKGWDI